jgi:hypothetical protein
MISSLKNDLENYLSRKGLAPGAKAALVCQIANAVINKEMGKDVSTFVRAIQYKRAELVIEVSSSVWASEVQARSTSIINKTSEQAGHKIERLRYVDNTRHKSQDIHS